MNKNLTAYEDQVFGWVELRTGKLYENMQVSPDGKIVPIKYE